MSIQRRSRDGCWTCRRRKKKCDSTIAPCANCVRLGLECERNSRLVWEDDVTRVGMRRRGHRRPSRNTGDIKCTEEVEQGVNIIDKDDPIKIYKNKNLVIAENLVNSYANRLLGRSGTTLRTMSAWPFELDTTEALLLDHYINRFSRTYPAFSDPSNPFLRVYLPLSTQNRVVLDSLLALSGAQSWENGAYTMHDAMLRLRQKALRGCRTLLTTQIAAQNETTLYLLASCSLLLLYEKLTGEGQENWAAHLQFLACQFARYHFHDGLRSANRMYFLQTDTFQFMATLFLYNDLLRSTSLRITTLSDYYLGDIPGHFRYAFVINNGERFIFPRLIAGISAGDMSITDSEIDVWDGDLDWLPSFSLLPPQNRWTSLKIPLREKRFIVDPRFRRLESITNLNILNESGIMSTLYRIAAMVYRRQCSRNIQPELQSINRSIYSSDADEEKIGNLALWATQLIQLLPHGSPYESMLLWPIGVTSKELTLRDNAEREYILLRLKLLVKRFRMRHFERVYEYLVRHWGITDQGISSERDNTILIG
ncbi:fungal-specific transcription factor domain-containing protein [Xylogone sp. PMI_703]|nr:fungal-specific transcription factor domain-containing protein [Xylogone sp. PMI_703]